MNLNVAATKTNLLKFRKSLELIEEGYELLDEKRKILINELMTILHITEKLQQDVDSALKEAYRVLDKAYVIMGKRKLKQISLSVDIKNNLSISYRRIMGVTIPTIGLEIRENPPYYSPLEVSFYVDETIMKFKEMLKLFAQLAEKKLALLRIAKEVKKTIRKVNALEKIYLPLYRDTVKLISDRIDEESREAFSMLKLIKERIKS